MEDTILLNISTTVVENKNLLFQLNNQTTFKQDLNYVQTINISQLSNFTLYETYLIIDNSLFNQNISYNMIQYVRFKNEDSLLGKLGQNKVITLEIMLFNNSNIILEFPEYEENLAYQVYNIIVPRLNNQNFSQNNSYQQTNSYQPNNTFNQQNFNNPQSVPTNYQQIPKQKNVLIAIILHIFLTGLGYAYVDKWDKFIITFVALWICVFLSFLIIPIFIALGIWIYSLIDSIRMVERYNNGEIL